MWNCTVCQVTYLARVSEFHPMPTSLGGSATKEHNKSYEGIELIRASKFI
jgi:hypothetical protein